MFFPKLRRRAKWVFLLLALVFAGGFLFFGVGTGVQGAGIGDVIGDIFGTSGDTDQPEVESARAALAEDPNNAEAQLELARALIAENQTQEAIVAYAQYVELVPNDVDALIQLGTLYTVSANDLQNQAAAVQIQSGDDLFGADFAPEGALGDALRSDPITDAIAAEATEALSAAIIAAQDEYAKAAEVYVRLTELEPDNPQHFLQLGQASQLAGDLEGAIDAYETFLVLSPDDANAPIVEGQLEELRTAVGTDLGAEEDAGGVADSEADDGG